MHVMIWSASAGVVVIDWVMLHAVKQGLEGIEELEKLKYNAKGA